MTRSTHLEVTIVALGADGDGMAETDRGRLYVPDALPGERVKIRLRREKGGVPRGEVLERLEDGGQRTEPVCPHFARCGGCAVQHVEETVYRTWKRGLVESALTRRGLDASTLGDLAPGAPGRRRRTRLFVRLTGSGAVIGFREARSHRIVAISECPVLAPRLAALLPALPALFRTLLQPGGRAELAMTLTDNGLDLTLYAAAEPDLPAREALAAFAEAQDIARLSWAVFGDGATAETIVRRRAPAIRFGGVAVEPPPDAFLQPTAEGEAALRDRIDDALDGARRVADLYAGCGAFALPLAAAGRHVRAADSAADHIAALETAARAAGFGERVSAEARDLHRRPLAGPELRGLDAIALDPPRAGAAAQIAEIAVSAVPVVAYVSCDPRSFARDARALCDGGYRLDSVTAVDQFLYTPHVELAGIFRKG